MFRPNKPAERDSKLLFIDATNRYSADKNQNTMSEDDIAVIDAAKKRGVEIDSADGLSLRLVDLAEIEENGFELNICRYLRGETESEFNVDEALVAYMESREPLAAAGDVLAEKLKAAGFDI